MKIKFEQKGIQLRISNGAIEIEFPQGEESAPTPVSRSKGGSSDLLIYFSAIKGRSLIYDIKEIKEILKKINGISDYTIIELLHGYDNLVSIWFAKHGSLVDYNIEKARQINNSLP